MSNGHLYFWIRGTKERLRRVEWEEEMRRAKDFGWRVEGVSECDMVGACILGVCERWRMSD